MVFLEGKHSLESLIEVTNCHNFTMTGNGSTQLYSDGLPQPTSWINCTGASGNGLFFINSSEIHIIKLGLDSCSGKTTIEEKFTIYFALAFDQVSNLTLYQIVINNTRGFGLHCDNVFGEIHVSESAFVNSKGDSSTHVYGGNARFWFGSPCSTSKSNLVIDTTWFMYGEETAYKVYNASGLQVLIACPNISVVMENITAHGNRGINGGNLALSLDLTYFGSDVSTIDISNSNISNGWAVKGGGIRFWSQIETGSSVQENTHNNTIILNIFNSTFSNNVASITGGALYIAHYEAENDFGYRLRQIRFINCSFVGNKGNGAVMEILKQTVPGYVPHITPQFSVCFNCCGFHTNSVPSGKHSSIMELIGTKNIRLSNCNFTNSSGTVFSLRSSFMNFFGYIHFENNHATYGGALKICDSSLIYLHSGTTVSFINNSALKGGAIYAQQGCLDTAPACFFQPAINRTVPIEDFGSFVKVRFVNNSASLAGDAIYGGSVDFCYTLKTFSYNGSYGFFNNKHIFQKISNMTEQNGFSNISSNPRGVCFCDLVNVDIMCELLTANLSLYPGQKFNVSVTTVGQYKGSTIGIVDANFVNGHPTDKLISFNNTIAHKGCANLMYKVLSNRTKAMIVNFTVVTNDVNVYYNPVNASLVLSLLPCPLGFHMTKKQCDCNPLLQTKDILNPVKCDIDKQVIHIPPSSQLWLGCDIHGSDTVNQSQCYLAVSTYCSHHCVSHHHRINTSNLTSFDDQCLLGRTGILCGACKSGLSCVLGSLTKCKSCSSWNLLFLIPIFLLSGLCIITLLTILNLTVTEGTINGLIVYANVVYPHQVYFHIPSSHIFSRICWIFIAWLNFDIGFELCFYKGMDSYQKVWLLYGFIVYLIIVQVIIVVLCRRFVVFTRLFGRNIVKVLATLLFLTYSPLTYALQQTFQCTHLHISTPNCTKKSLVWYFDGNVPYLGAKHIPLFTVGIICAIAVCWFTLSLLLVQCLQRRAHLFCFRWVEKFRPFFEAYTGPCRDTYRFWPGFLLFIRLILYVLNTTTLTFINSPSQRKLTSFGTAVICMMILSLSCIFPHGVYKKWSLNILEFSFFLNLCISSSLWTISEHYTHSVVRNSVSVAMFTFLGILTYHIGVKVRSKVRSNACGCLKFKTRLLKLTEKIPFKHQVRLYCCPNESEDNDETTPLLSQPLPPVIQYNQYREPLIGDTNN